MEVFNYLKNYFLSQKSKYLGMHHLKNNPPEGKKLPNSMGWTKDYWYKNKNNYV